jgi:uncharacterized repeat protein (TIGR03803 family)
MKDVPDAGTDAPSGSRTLPILFSLLTSLLCVAQGVALSQPAYEVVRVLLGGTYPTFPTALLQATDGNFYALTAGGALAKGAIVRVTPAGVTTVLHSFTSAEGPPPFYGLPQIFFQASDGNIYGRTLNAVFKMSLAGEFSVLTISNAGQTLWPSELVEGRDGNLYGVATTGQSCSEVCGAFFRMSPSGGATILYEFSSANNLSYPNALIAGVDGDFYGTANGRVFRVTPDGGLTVIATASSDLVLKLQGSDGTLYGTSYGIIYGVTRGGWVRRLYSFGSGSGYEPIKFVQGNDGNIYVRRFGYDSDTGTDDNGQIFRMTPGGEVTLLHAFTDSPDGKFPVAFFQGHDGTFYGATREGGFFGAGGIFSFLPTSASVSFLKSFSFGAEGRFPYGALVDAGGGNFYGTSSLGGEFDAGTIFSVTPAGALTVLQSFTSFGGLTKGPDGELFGVRTRGGAFGRGSIFRMTPSGALTTIHDFAQWNYEGPDSAFGGLVYAPDGNLYGSKGGAIVRVTLAGVVTPLTADHSFGSLTLGSDGNLYAPGSDASSGYRSAIFRVALGGAVTLLHVLDPSIDGSYPSRLMQSNDGNFYGTTPYGGPFDGGTAFRISPDGAFAVLHAFGAIDSDARGPAQGLTEASDSNFYGTTYPTYGVDGGRIYRMTRQGVVTILHAFDRDGDNGNTAGYLPAGELTEGDNGDLYGVVYYGGGPSAAGLIYRLNFHRAPPAAPTLVRAAPATNQGVRVRWSQPLGATSFGVKRAVGDGSYVVVASGLTDASYVDTAVTSGQRYHYVVTAFNEMGEGVGSYEVAITAGRTVRGDLDGDGMADLVWRHSTGAVTIWQMRDFSVIGGGAVATVDPAWTIAGVGDFDGDTHADLLWRHSQGAVVLWLMHGSTVRGGGTVGWVHPEWHIVGTGDYNGDGRSDVLWREDNGTVAIWTMNGATITGVGTVGGPPPDRWWHLAGTGDLDGDGTADLLWRVVTTGDVAVWLIKNAHVARGAGIAQAVDGAWAIAATGDFNGDGKADILWRRMDGAVTVWLMDGERVVGGGPTQPFAEVDPAWQIVATGDYTGDGRDDILWRDAAGTVSMWFMDGRQAIGGGEVGRVDPVWQIVSAP